MKYFIAACLLWLSPLVASAQILRHKISYSHATDCTTNITNAKARQLCVDLDDGRVWRCEPSAGDCDTAAEWIAAYNPPLFSIAQPSPADTMSYLVFKARYDITITDIHCIIDPADTSESVVIDLRECNSTGDSCATVDATITCDNDGAEDDGSLSNGTIDSGDWILLDIGAVTGTVTDLTVTVYN